MNILFVCSANVDRSPTAEYIYANRQGLEVKSAGTSWYATTPINNDLLHWADVILCMENHHKQVLEKEFADIVSHKVIDSLDIPDIYSFKCSSLIGILKEKVDNWLNEYQAK